MSERAGPVIRLTDVKKEFRARGRPPIEALRGVDLSIPSGSMVAIKGPSGSGKTTLLHMIGALDVPTSGSVEVAGEELTGMNDAQLTDYRAKTIGFVFQAYHLIPNLTARENVALPMELLGTPPADRRRRALELLTEVGMEERAESKPLKLSGGEAQRVAIARALANEPAILLADEPTGNLDSASGDSVLKLLDRLNKEKGRTVVIVTHSSQIPPLCDRTFTIRDGRVTSEQESKELLRQENVKRSLRTALSASEKIVDRLVAAGLTDAKAVAAASIEQLTDILRDKNKALRIQRRARVIAETDDLIE
jgi:putative ABC transport system ATP-binding protein